MKIVIVFLSITLLICTASFSAEPVCKDKASCQAKINEYNKDYIPIYSGIEAQKQVLCQQNQQCRASIERLNEIKLQADPYIKALEVIQKTEAEQKKKEGKEK